MNFLLYLDCEGENFKIEPCNENPCPVNCQWGSWTEFSQCHKSCGGGKTFRTRTKLVTEKYGGTCQGLAKFEKECNMQDCPGKL